MNEGKFVLIQPYYFGEGIRIFLREKSCSFKNGLPCTKVQSPRTAHSGRTVDFTLKYIYLLLFLCPQEVGLESWT